ncbi:AsmA family protein [Thioalkalivibrio sp.]|uniref:AsmA family protein n=1 Tax=Thioalkalivibrio sp. TaxID=2093813 RepID=UPI0035640995
MKWIVRLLGLLGVLLLIAVIVAVYLVATFDPNDYKGRIEAEVAEATGRELTLAGSIELTLFPSLGLRLEDARLANAEGFGEAPFAELRVIDLAVAVMPLLRRELEVQRIEADGVTLRLARDADGRSNWDDLLERSEAAAAEEPDNGPGNSGAEGAPGIALEELQVAGLEVTGLRVEWDDRQAGTFMLLDPVNLELRDFRPGVETPIDLAASVRIEEADQAPVAADLRLDARLNLDLAAERYALRAVRSEVDLRHPALEQEVSLRLETDLVLDMADATARADSLSAHLSDLHLTGRLEVSGLDAEMPSLQAELRSNTFNPRVVFTSLGLDAPRTTDREAFTRMELDVSASGTPLRLELNPVLVTLDDTSMRGDGEVDLAGDRPVVRFDLAGDRLDVDRYLPPEVERARTPETPDAPDLPAEDIPIDLPVELMRAFDLDGHLRLDWLKLFGLTLEDIDLTLRARDGEWNVEPLTGNGYQGRLEARATVDAGGEVPGYAAAVDLRSVAIGPLLEALLEDESRLVGTGNLALDVRTGGGSVNALMAGLNGQGEMRFSDGAVRGINIARIIRNAEARLRGETPKDEGEPDETDFTALAGSFRIRDGVVQNDDLTASSPLLRVAGRGSADLPAREIDYRLDTTLVATIEGQGGRSLEDLRGLTLPIRITGSFEEPRFRLDLEEVVRERVDQRLRREGEQLQERLLERFGLDDGAGDQQEAAPESGDTESGPLEEQMDRLRRGFGERLRLR